MDKYVTKVPRCKYGSGNKLVASGNCKQVSLKRLKGVVVIEDIQRINELIRVADQDPAVLVSALEQLAKKIPSREVLKATKIGHAVKRLAKHTDRRVAQLAVEVIGGWKQHFEKKLTQPLVDVHCDHKTEAIRQTARKRTVSALLSDKSSDKQVAENLAADTEQHVFNDHRHLITGSYQRTMRRIILALQQRPQLRSSLIENHLTVAQLVSDFKD